MIVIKRYVNNKLYNTNNFCYIGYNDILHYLKANIPFEVIDNKSKTNITGIILSETLNSILKEKSHKRELDEYWLKDLILEQTNS